MAPVLRARPADEWNGVSAEHPCPICAASAGCHLHSEDDFASCSRRPSDWPLTNGGWLHRVEPPASARDDVSASAGAGVDDSPVRLRA